MQEGQWYQTSPQFGQTMLVGENKYGSFMDEEAPKKSITDCISKCAVLLGIGADVHLGLFDDNKYVNQRKQEEAANGNGHADEHPIERQAREAAASNPKADPALAMKQWITEAERSAKACTTQAELTAWEDRNKAALVKLHGLDPKAHKKLMDALQERHAALSPLAA